MARKPAALARELLRNFPKGRRGNKRRRRKSGSGADGDGAGRRSDAPETTTSLPEEMETAETALLPVAEAGPQGDDEQASDQPPNDDEVDGDTVGEIKRRRRGRARSDAEEAA
jgi:ribonuclease E